MISASFHPDHLTEMPFGLAGRVFRSPMPFRPGDEQGDLFQEYQQVHISVVVVVAEEQECYHQTSRNLIEFYTLRGLHVISYPIRDYGVPSSVQEFRLILEAVLDMAKAGHNIAVHCNAGFGRTGTFMACLARQVFGFDGNRAIDWVRSYLPPALENPDQIQFVLYYNPVGE